MKRFLLCLSALWALALSAQNIVSGVAAIEEGTTRIAAKQFADNTNITELIIPSSVTEIGGGAFKGCTNLRKVTYNAKDCPSAGSLFSPAFAQCKSLSEVVIGEDVTTIPSSLFTNCKGITKVDIPSSVRVIGNSAFSSTNLTEVTIPEGVTTLGSFAFGITLIKEVTLPASIESIGEGAFPKSTKIICPSGSYAARWAAENGYACDELSTGGSVVNSIARATVPTSTTNTTSTSSTTSARQTASTQIAANTSATAASASKTSATSKTTTTASSAKTSTSNTSKWTKGRAVPPKEKGYFTFVPAASKTGYKEISYPKASSEKKLTTAKPVNGILRIPEGTTHIEDNQYKGVNLKELHIPASVVSIGKNAFSDSYIDNIYFNAVCARSAATNNSASPFRHCHTSNITFGKQTRLIDQRMFVALSFNSQLIEIPGNVETIGDYAFFSFEGNGLHYFVLREGVKSIGDKAFHGEKKYSNSRVWCPHEVVLPRSLEHLGEGALSLATDLIVTKGSWAEQFAKDHRFEYFHDGWSMHYNPNKVQAKGTIKNGVLSFQSGATYIENEAYKNNTSFHTLVIPESMKDLGYDTFDGCTNLKRIEYNAEYLEFGEQAFADCPNVEEIVLGPKVCHLPKEIFKDCSKVTSINFPASLRSIESWAFLKTGIKDFILPEGIENLGTYAIPMEYHSKVYFPSSLLKMENLGSFDRDTYYGCEQGTYAEKYLTSKNVKHFFRKADLLAGRDVKPDEDFVTELPGSTELRSENILPYPNETEICSATPEMLSWIKNGVLTIPEGTKSLPTNAFRGHREITRIVFPSSLTNIGICAFYKCIGLKEVTIPGTVKTLGNNSFDYCVYLEKVVLKEGVESIGYNSFFRCSNLKTIEVPASVKDIPVRTETILVDGYKTKFTNGTITFDASLIVKRGSYAEKWAIDNKHDYQYTYGGKPEGVTEVYSEPLLKVHMSQRHLENPYTNGYKTICQHLAMAQALHHYGPPQGSTVYNSRPSITTQNHTQILFADFDADAKEFNQIKDEFSVYDNDEMLASDHFVYNIANVICNRIVFNDDFLYDLAMQQGEDPMIEGAKDCHLTEPQRMNIEHHYPVMYNRASVTMFDKNASESLPTTCEIPIRESIKRGWPLLISTRPNKEGHEDAVGHAFVIDGARMKNGKFQIHVDLGHGGYENGWYDLDGQMPSGYITKIRLLVPLEGEALARWRPWRLTPEAIAAYKAEKHHEIYFDHGMLYLPEGIGYIYGDDPNPDRNTIGHLGVKPEKITSVRMPLTLQVIQTYAFNNCSNLKEITIPENVREWHTNSFFQCKSLETLHYNAIWCDDNEIGIKQSPTWPTLKTITIGPKVERIPAYLFYDRMGIHGVIELPACCKEVGEFAFYRTSIEKVILPKGCKVGQNAFPPTATVVYK